jgi:hypothetical protein
MLSFEIRRQQSQYTIIFNVSIEQGKGFQETAPVKAYFFHQMPAGKGLRGAAAFKNSFGGKWPCCYCMCFKKRNRQRRDVFERLNCSRNGPHQLAPFPVNRVLMVLKLKSIQALAVKMPGRAAYRENIVNIKCVHCYVL